jgi:phosphate transport system ATP-binding protein
MTDHLIETKNVNAYFGTVHAVKGVSLAIGSKEVVAMIGPSGCGKSTFLRCINRLHEEVPGARVTGEVLVEGRNIYEAGVDPVEIRQKVGMVFQKPNPFPGLSIYENVAIGLRLKGLAKKSLLSDMVEKALHHAALWEEVKDKLNAPGMSLSGGQQQRLCIARTLATNPPAILMDEPTSALDPISTAKIEELIFELKKDITIVIVTHNMQQASRVSDKTAFFLMGNLIEVGPTAQIFTQPKKPKTEEYITGRFG